MFTLQQIKDAHSNVQTGADFPKYIKDLKELGVVSYDTFTSDGHATYCGSDDCIDSESKYSPLVIASSADSEQFSDYLRLHQQGGSDYMMFCQHAAQTGVHHWTVDLQSMTCSYYDLEGNVMLIEAVPEF